MDTKPLPFATAATGPLGCIDERRDTGSTGTVGASAPVSFYRMVEVMYLMTAICSEELDVRWPKLEKSNPKN